MDMQHILYNMYILSILKYVFEELNNVRNFEIDITFLTISSIYVILLTILGSI
jgi:HKD family nuclease